MYKKQAKKKNVNQVGVHKNTPLAIQIPHEEYEEFINKYLEVSSPEDIFELLDQKTSSFACECSITEEMLLDCLIDEDTSEDKTIEKNKDNIKELFKKVKSLNFDDEESNMLHSENYNNIFNLYKKQKKINRRNALAIKEYIDKPLEYFGNVKLLRDVDETLENVFRKKKYKKQRKGNKIFDRMTKPVDNSAAEEILNRRTEFKSIFPSLEFPVYEGNLCEDNVDTEEIIKDKFIKY